MTCCLLIKLMTMLNSFEALRILSRRLNQAFTHTKDGIFSKAYYLHTSVGFFGLGTDVSCPPIFSIPIVHSL